MNPLPIIITLGILMFVMTVFEALLGRRVIHFKGKTHALVHRYNGYAIIAIAVIHGTIALGTFVFGWF
jgi:hypothetical protein